MVLEDDVLGVVVEFMDSLNINPTHQVPAEKGLAECRRVSHAWCRVVDNTIEQVLPPMPSESLASLVVPDKLHAILLSCRYVSHDHHHYDRHHAGDDTVAIAVYNSLLSRACACVLQLSIAVAVAKLPPRPVATLPLQPLWGGKTSSDANENRVVGEATCLIGTIAVRVALKRVVEQILASPIFSWCSTLGLEDSRVLEGCVGVSSLLNARWFAV